MVLLFILASSVCWSLQCLISALTQGGGSGHFFRLPCSVVLWGGTLQTNNTGVCSQCLSHTGFAPAHSVCAFLVYTAQALDCSAGEVFKVGPALHALPMSMCSGSLVLHKGTDPDGLCSFYPFWVQATKMIRCLVSSLSQVAHESYAPPQSLPPFPQVCCKGTVPSVVMYLLCEGDLRL